MDLMETKACILEQICLEAPESTSHKFEEDKYEFILMDKQILAAKDEEG